MSAEEVAQLLRNLGACIEARKWAEGKDLATIWSTCDQPDWLLWLVARMEGKPGWPARQQIVLVACDCEELAAHYAEPGEDRSCITIAIEAARKWARGEATIEEVRKAAAADTYAAAAAAAAAAHKEVQLKWLEVIRAGLTVPLAGAYAGKDQ